MNSGSSLANYPRARRVGNSEVGTMMSFEHLNGFARKVILSVSLRLRRLM